MITDFHQIKKILVIRLSSLGDVILTTPVVRALKQKYPHIKIDFLVRQNYVDAVKFNPNLNVVYTFERDIDTVLTEKYDLVIDLQNNRRSKKLSAKLKTPVVQYSKPQIKKFLLVHFNLNLFDEIIPISERYAENLKNLEVEAPPEIFTGDTKVEDHEIFSNGKITVGVCPGSRHYTKMWPVEYFKKLCAQLKDAGFNVVIFGGNSDIETGEDIANSVSGVLNFTNQDRLLETVFYMKQCKAVVCNDSGMMHTATAAGIPVLAIFGSTTREFGFAPYSNKSVVVENSELSCRPCSHIGKASCPKGHFKCMLDLPPELVFNKLKNLLEFHG